MNELFKVFETGIWETRYSAVKQLEQVVPFVVESQLKYNADNND
jgi:hypothetical protein